MFGLNHTLDGMGTTRAPASTFGELGNKAGADLWLAGQTMFVRKA
jgi:hypothetical protein